MSSSLTETKMETGLMDLMNNIPMRDKKAIKTLRPIPFEIPIYKIVWTKK